MWLAQEVGDVSGRTRRADFLDQNIARQELYRSCDEGSLEHRCCKTANAWSVNDLRCMRATHMIQACCPKVAIVASCVAVHG